MTSGPTFIGESKPIQIVKKQINLVSGKNAWILISGENGTGKEELAKSIHSASTKMESRLLYFRVRRKIVSY